MNIIVLDGYTLNPGDNPWDDVAQLGEFICYSRTAEDQIVERAKDADIVLTNKTPLSAEVIDQLPNLKFISVLATGFNIVDIAHARRKGIRVSNVPIYGTDAVAEFVMSLLLNFWRQPQMHSNLVKQGRWKDAGDFCFWDTPLAELRGKTMGIVGFGRIGRRTGELAAAFGMKVIAFSMHQKNPPSYDFEWVKIDEVFKHSDVVSIHCPQTEDNAEMVNRELLSLMKPSAYFINTSRGGLVHEADMANALNNGTIAGAALDVLSCEPIKDDNPLLKAKNVTLTPHIAWAALEARQRLMGTTADNIKAFQNGECINVVN